MENEEIATVLPRELRLGVPPTMPQARSYLFRQQSTLSDYLPEKTITINIPRLQRSYLRKDSYLRFTVDAAFKISGTANTTADIILDNAGAFGFFEKLEVFDYLGSTVLEQISGVPQLTALLLDMGLEGMISNTSGTVDLGLGNSYAVTPTLPAVGEQKIFPSNIVRGPCTGKVLEPVRFETKAGVDVDTTAGLTTYEFCIPLPSFLGFLSKKMIPLHNGFTIVLTLAKTNIPLFLSQNLNGSVTVLATPSGTATSAAPTTTNWSMEWKLRDVYMQCQILELGPVAESMLLSSTQGQPLICHTKSFRNYSTVVTGATWNAGAVTATGPSEFQLNMNLNVASLTNVLWFMRPDSQTDSMLFQSVGHRTRNFLHRWTFQYGSTTLPQNSGIIAMNTTTPSLYSATANDCSRYLAQWFTGQECYRELMKSRPVDLASSRMDFVSYCNEWKYQGTLDQATQTAGTTIGSVINVGSAFYPHPTNPLGCARFACGLNLELVPNKQGDMICGLNTNGMNTSIRGQFHPSYTNFLDKVRVDAYAEYDAFINISPGIATTVSF